jgi:hypothetical protein
MVSDARQIQTLHAWEELEGDAALKCEVFEIRTVVTVGNVMRSEVLYLAVLTCFLT